MGQSGIIDISLPLSGDTPVYPGDPAVEFEEREGKTSMLTKITFGAHAGTHFDAPRHVFSEGKTLDQFSLDHFYGPCRVFDFTQNEESVKKADFEKKDIKEGERILVKTKNSLRGFDSFYENFVYLDGEAAEYLAEKKISLFGIDSWSVKQKGGQDLRPHTVLLENEIIILESIDLSNVKEGEYLFIGFPLKFIGLEGSPARIILISS